MSSFVFRLVTILIVVGCLAAVAILATAPDRPTLRVESVGRLTIFHFQIHLEGISNPLKLRVVTSRDIHFRVTAAIARDFPDLRWSEVEDRKVLWIQERQQPREEHLPANWVGVFRGFDGEPGWVRHYFHAYRVYRKFASDYEVDYSFGAQHLTREDLAGRMHAIDRMVLETLQRGGAFRP